MKLCIDVGNSQIYAGLFSDIGLFNHIHPDLVLEGISIAQEMNA